jgi:GNAT superfamily N-acetyltransferase
VYRLNEPGRFPSGYADIFSKQLRQGDIATIVVEQEGRTVGFGSLSIQEGPGISAATLGFGMIRPSHHGRGFGTAVLLGRLCALPKPLSSFRTIVISTVATSTTFYQRFGFQNAGSYPDEYGYTHDFYRTNLYENDWQACKSLLARSDVSLDVSGMSIPKAQIGKNLRTYRA